MLSVQQQLAKRAKQLGIDCLKRKRETSDRTLLSKVFSQWKEYKRMNKPISIIQRLFMRSIWYIIKMRILKKKRQMIDETTCPSHQLGEFLRRKQNRLEAISRSRDFKNDNWTRMKVFLLGFIRTHNPVVNEEKFILKFLKMLLSQEEIDYIHKIMENQTFIQFFESTRKTLDKNRAYISDLLWFLYYLSSERLPKSWFPNPESDFAFVFEELKSVLGRMIQAEAEEAEEVEEEAEPHLAEQPEQSAYCSQCGGETIQGMCFDAECMRRRESACASCGNPILEGSNAVVIDGMRLHQDCANHNQHNPHFRNYTECSLCSCSSNDMSFFEGIGLLCHDCMIANQ
jgi:hypothetical protein